MLVLLSLIACGPDCQSSCDKLFGDGSEECNITVAGNSDAAGQQRLTRDCVTQCESALARTGEIGDYSPNERPNANDEVSLENEKQAAMWMDCIAETECEYLKDNYCAPTTNFQ